MARAMRVKAMRAWRGMGNSGMYSALQGTGGLQARVEESREPLLGEVEDAHASPKEGEGEAVGPDAKVLPPEGKAQDHRLGVHEDPLVPAELAGQEEAHLGVVEAAQGGHQGHHPGEGQVEGLSLHGLQHTGPWPGGPRSS